MTLDGSVAQRNALRLLALALAVAAAAPAAAQSFERWSLDCRASEAGRVCSLTTPLAVRAPKSRDNAAQASWIMENRAIGIHEALKVEINASLMPTSRLIGISDEDRRSIATARGDTGEISATVARLSLDAGKDMIVIVIDDATGRETIAKLPAAGFVAAREAMLAELAKGANRK